MVPLGPRFDLSTEARPLAALMFMKRAAAGPMTSALGLSVLTEEADAMAEVVRGREKREEERKKKNALESDRFVMGHSRSHFFPYVLFGRKRGES